ncbi:N-acetyltransferase [Staphylococcus croceilyticus]|uniref:N-acetyltransferase n=1 Tax=Staphylococcus croceilyticus TaxID=319942 RepID=A0ABY2KJY6_9STAP|nr:GNAT family protein [Staphylococcus croceilyticus]PNZ67463.1 GNAT family N-acetyltransferase [Staphylococcus croceilyticus]TGA80780.1 N-acetyltransferase [Staphylococcus croceilyticus]
MRVNEFKQPIGETLDNYVVPSFPDAQTLEGRYGTLTKLSINHTNYLYDVLCDDESRKNWTYLYEGPFDNKTTFEDYIRQLINSKDKYFFTIKDNTQQQPLGILALMRINPEHGSIEVGNIIYSNQLKKTRVGTEVQYLLAKYVFETLSYRRYEWKCDNLNTPSKHAAQRFGFTFEGVFRHSNICKGRNRDTAWFSMLDNEWPSVKTRFEQWLEPDNFDEKGHQIKHLSDFS